MNKKISSIITYGLMGAVLCGALVYYNFIDKSDSDHVYKVGEKAPLQDLDYVFNNEGKWNSSNYLGKPIVVNFWAEWCGPCVKEMPFFIKAYEDYAKDNVEFLAVHDAGTSIDDIEFCIKSHWGNDCKIPFARDDKDSPYVQKFSAEATLPVTIMIDTEGTIFDIHVGSYTETSLRNKIDELINR